MAEFTPVDLHQKRDIGEVINGTFTLLRQIYKYMIKDLLLITGPFFILAGVFNALTQYSFTFNGGMIKHGPFEMISSPEYFVSILCLIVGWSVAYCICINHVHQYDLNKGRGYDTQAVRSSLSKDVWRVIGANFLLGLIVIAGLILLIVPGIYFGIALSLTAIIVVLQKDMAIGKAMSESRRLVTNNWWRTVGLGFIMAFIVGAISMVFSIPLVIFTGIIAFHSAQGGDVEQYRLTFIIISCVAQLGSALVTPVSVVAMSLYYFTLKEEKDQDSLLAKIDNIGTEQPLKTQDEGSY